MMVDHNEMLFESAKNGDLGGIIDAIAHHVDVRIKDDNGYTPLMFASANGQLKAIKYILNYVANPSVKVPYINMIGNDGFSSLMLASANGHTAVVEYLLKNGAYVNARNTQRYTPLMLASSNGHIKIAECLFEATTYSIDRILCVNAMNNDKETVLSLALKNNHTDVAEFLKSKGATEFAG